MVRLEPLELKFPDWMHELDQQLNARSNKNGNRPHLNKFKHDYSNWSASNEPDGGLTLSIDVKHFAPSELIVRTTENTVCVEGQHSNKKQNDQKNISRYFIRQYQLPKGIDANEMITTLSPNGVLTMKTPPPKCQMQVRKRKASKIR